jgi:hypothetical protein
VSSAEAEALAIEIDNSGLSIYDDLGERPDLYFPLDLLQIRLRDCLIGQWLGGPIRSRSKLAKQLLCQSLGYRSPLSFQRVQPRFPGQQLDIYVQQATNLQVWNEEVDPTRRYAIVRPNADDIVDAVRVVTGDVLAAMDTTGTLTSKYQAKRIAGRTGSRLVSGTDTRALLPFLGEPRRLNFVTDATGRAPTPGKVLPVAEIYRRLLPLVGTELVDPGFTQDRLRGEALQAAAAAQLAAGRYENFGQWPDIRSQALELKLQTSPTIDLGLVLPSSAAPAETLAESLTHSDVRYAVFYGSTTARGTVSLDALVVSTGADFFTEFQAFGGGTRNSKTQLHLPQGFFDAE